MLPFLCPQGISLQENSMKYLNFEVNWKSAGDADGSNHIIKHRRHLFYYILIILTVIEAQP